MKQLFIITLIFFCQTLINAQSHVIEPDVNCKYNKVKYGTEAAICPVCANINKKEKEAKAAEDKRRSDVLEAKAKAEKEARDKAWQDKIAEDKKKAESGKVYINANTSVVKGIVEPVKKATNVTDKTVMIGSSLGGSSAPQVFKNEKDEILLENKEWTRTYSFGEKTLTGNNMNNIGIVKIGDPHFHWKNNTYHLDIVNSKGEYLFNNDHIGNIVHLKDGWLLISCFDLKENHLYNLYSKKKIMLENIIDNDNIRFCTVHSTLQYFLPIFSEIISQHRNYEDARIANWSEAVKKNLSRKYGSQINEEFLNAHSFILVHTNGATNYLYDVGNLESYEHFKAIVLYCMSKNGELTTIKLR